MNRKSSRRPVRHALPTALFTFIQSLVRWVARLATPIELPCLAMARPSSVRWRIERLASGAPCAGLSTRSIALAVVPAAVLAILTGLSALSRATAQTEYHAMTERLENGQAEAGLSQREPAADGKLTQTLECGARVRGIAISPDGKLLVACLYGGRRRASDRIDTRFQVWSLADGRLLLERDVEPRYHGAQSASFSSDGRVLAIAGRGSQTTGPVPTVVSLWDTATWKIQGVIDTADETAVHPGRHVSWSPDGSLLAITQPGSVKIVSAANVQEEKSVSWPGLLCTDTAFVPGTSQLIVGGWEAPGAEWGSGKVPANPVRVVDLEDTTVRFDLPGYEGWPFCVASCKTTSGATRFAAAGQTAPARARLVIWHPERSVQHLAWTGPRGAILDVAFSPHGELLASVGTDKTLRVWDTESGKPLASLTGHRDRIWSVAFSPDGRLAATGSEDGTVRLWDLSRIEE